MLNSVASVKEAIFKFFVTSVTVVITDELCLSHLTDWPDPEVVPPVVKTALHAAGQDTRIRCQVQQRFRNIQKGLNLTWEFKVTFRYSLS